MKLDDDKEALAILQNGIGAYNNRARAIYNKGYQQGLKDGKREAIEMLMQNIDTMTAKQTEPQIDCKDCKYAWWNGDAKRYECSVGRCRYTQTERGE